MAPESHVLYWGIDVEIHHKEQVMEEIPVVHIRQTRMITVKLAGASFDWLAENTAWGTMDQDAQLDKDARVAVMASEGRKVGKGWSHTVKLPDEQAESVWSILHSIAGVGETMTAEERGDDAYAFRIMRRDADRIKESLIGIGWTFNPQGYFTVSAAPTKARYRDYQDRLDLVICGDCSTRATLALIERDEIAEHDSWHAEVAPK